MADGAKSIEDKIFSDYWFGLTEQKRKEKIGKAFKIIREVASKQVNFFKEVEKNGNPDGYRFLYFIKTCEDTWLKADVVFGLGKGKYRDYTYYFARTILENVFRLEYFTRQTKEKQEEIAVKELLRICKRHYDNEIKNGNLPDAEEFKIHYDNVVSAASYGTYPKIEDIRMKELDLFPSLKDLTSKTKIEGGGSWYFNYQALAEQSHGKLFSLIGHNGKLSEYTRSFMYIIPLCNDLLKNADFHLGGKTRDDVVAAIKKAEKVVKNIPDGILVINM